MEQGRWLLSLKPRSSVIGALSWWLTQNLPCSQWDLMITDTDRYTHLPDLLPFCTLTHNTHTELYSCPVSCTCAGSFSSFLFVHISCSVVQCTQSTPFLPTSQQYLESVRPLLDSGEYNQMEVLANDFKDTKAAQLQRYLILKSWWATNYVSTSDPRFGGNLNSIKYAITMHYLICRLVTGGRSTSTSGAGVLSWSTVTSI